ncbi:helix-turn-helix transcriptional regulator [Streptomyces sp. MST-110588]|uniref:helix-turn-helix transcriptional regulator n=1 Tax=Streptomyces sp. MST-110588 TaxID=2833628 RepID=UPI001F5C408A|nr:helix-turn-helix transcriptional regulator [Streptomyces sp. MST-110588]UNO39356.1 helix-turn-helix transcriptional regulator [Streptomyces sp. MST-110588]
MRDEDGPGGSVEVRAALSRLRRGSGLPVAFGGLSAGTGRYRISELSGTATAVLRGLSIHHGTGLGGKAAALTRPFAVTDYHSSAVISHEYDAAVTAEGLRSVLAVPVVVRRRVRGILYGALRRPLQLGDRALTAAMEAARELEQALLLQDEAQRLLSVARQPTAADPAMWEEVREAHGDLRALARRITDPLLRQEVLAVCGRIAAATTPGRAGTGVRDGAGVRDGVGVGVRDGAGLYGSAGLRGGAAVQGGRLSPREVDVLACVASGATNAEVAERLGLRPETVKSYLRSAMRKLGARTRLQAVVAARRTGLLP